MISRNPVILMHHILGRGHRFVRLMKSHIDKERLFLLLCLVSFHPVQSFIHHQLTTVSFEFADRLAIANKIIWVFMRWAGIVLGGKPMIKPSIIRLRLLRGIKFSIAVPLPTHTGGITCFFQKLRNGNFGLPHMNIPTTGDPVVHTCTVGTSAGKQAYTGRRTNRSSGVKIGKPHSIFCHLIKERRFDFGMPITRQVPVPQIIAKNDNNIRFSFCVRLKEAKEKE